MNSKTENQFTVKTWDKMNIFLFIASIITTSIFLILFASCFFIEIGSSSHSMVLGMCGVFASLGSAFFIAWIVRFHDLKKKQNQELKALELITPYLTTIFCTINKFFPHLKSFANIHPDDTIDYPTGVIYYTDSSINEENRSFVELNTSFKNAYSNLNHDLNECFKAPITFQCNEEIIKLLTGLKLNKLTYNLFEIYKASLDSFFSNTVFLDLYNNYNEFATYYETLSKLVPLNPPGHFIQLNDTEKADYIKEIATIKSKLTAKHSGEIYRGRVRIQ